MAFYLNCILLCLCLFSHTIQAEEPSPQKLLTLYNTLDPKSLSQHLAFYELYANTLQGEKAIQHAWSLIAPSNQISPVAARDIPLLPSLIPTIVAMVNKQPFEAAPELTAEEIAGINALASHLPNRQLKGYGVISEKELLQLPPDEIDLARGLFLSEMGEGSLRKIQSYEALLDLMALQILARIPIDASPKEKIRTINDFIFDEMGFRFPPHSIYAKNVDVYTFLPSVLDSRKGVCLGVSILYLCLAQRLALPLEMITPPGHIYVRYRSGKDVVNIETTARGINMPSENYLGIETRSLEMRNIKEVIGLTYMNQAAVSLHKKDYELLLSTYLKARDFLPDDDFLTELLGYTYLFNDNEIEGRKLLNLVKDTLPDEAIVKKTIAEDYLKGAVDAEGIKAVYEFVDETRESILDKQRLIRETLRRYPLFRAGWFQLAVTWLQLHRNGEAIKALEQYHVLDPNDPTAEYYLGILYASRLDYNSAWKHLRAAEAIVHARQHNPKPLQEMRRELSQLSPE